MLPEFVLFGHEFHSYPVVAILSVITGLILVCIQSRKLGYSFVFSLLLMSGILVGFFVGARLLNVAVNFSYFRLNPGAVLGLSFKGFSVIGGVFVSGVLLVIIHNIWKKDILKFFDSISIPFLFSFSMMKFGCFLNGCCSGKATTSCLGIVFPSKETVADPVKILNFLSGFVFGVKKVLPTQLFESVLALVIVIIVALVSKKHLQKRGDVFAFSMLLFFLMRLSVHFFRVFSYSPVIVYFVYPLIYLVFINLSILWLCRRELIKHLLSRILLR